MRVQRGMDGSPGEGETIDFVYVIRVDEHGTRERFGENGQRECGERGISGLM